MVVYYINNFKEYACIFENSKDNIDYMKKSFSNLGSLHWTNLKLYDNCYDYTCDKL